MRSKDETRSDANGRFHVQLITPGEAMLGIYPDKTFAPAVKFLYDKRGDLGAIKLERGPPISGQVLDLQGKPLPGVYVSIEPWTPSDPKYSDTSVNQQPKRVAQTDSEGKFSVAPLAPGEYRVEPKEELNDPTIDRLLLAEKHPLPVMFAPQKLTIADGQQFAKVEIRAIPTIAVDGHIYADDARYLVNEMKRAPSEHNTPAPAIEGKLNGLPYRATAQLDEDGKFRFSAPKGLAEAMMRIESRRNTSSAGRPRWRLGADQPIHSDPTIDLGMLNGDVHGIEIDYKSNMFGQSFGPDGTSEGGRGTRRRGTSPAPSGAGSGPTPSEPKAGTSPAPAVSEPAAQARAADSPPAAQPAKPATAAATQLETKPTPQGSDKPAPNATTPDEFTYTGTVQEKDPGTLAESLSTEERRDVNGLRERQQQEQVPGKPIARRAGSSSIFRCGRFNPAPANTWEGSGFAKQCERQIHIHCAGRQSKSRTSGVHDRGISSWLHPPTPVRFPKHVATA